MSSNSPTPGLHARLLCTLRDARRRRDLTAVAGLSAAAGALADAESIALPGEAAAILSRNSAPMRIPIGEHHVRRLLERQRDEREAEASACRARGESVRSLRLRGEASAIGEVLLDP